MGIKINEKTAKEWFKEGIVLKKLGKYKDAIKRFDKVIELNPKYVNAWNNKGYAFEKLGEYDKASNCYNKAKDVAGV